uniref:LBH domain-containing protein n=1 Tax=Leptobrachium leishanense TaxID=445787 RepID=A0A8C5MEF7_9ANUR
MELPACGGIPRRKHGSTMNEVSVLRLPVEEAVNEVIHSLEGVALKHSDNRLPFQIFPDPCEEEEVPVKMRGRLPSIVVEPTDIIDVESGELRWPPDSLRKENKEDMLEEEETEEEEQEDQKGKLINLPGLPSFYIWARRITCMLIFQ